jgi:hypothetical protein
MGCHTWFSVPLTTDRKKILWIAQKSVDEMDVHPTTKMMYQYAIDSELVDPVCNLAASYSNSGTWEDWIIYQGVLDYSLSQYNKEHNTKYDRWKDYEIVYSLNLESYSDEPRIGGYPNRVIHSYDDMVKFMSTGHDDEDGDHYDFYFEEDRIENVMEGIKTFFEKHPYGIITFG